MKEKITTKAEEIRNVFKDNSDADLSVVADRLDISKSTLCAYLSKDIKSGRCIKTETGYDYTNYFNGIENHLELRKMA